VVAVESGFRTNAVSSKGAIGLMQLMPATAREYGANPNDPEQNVEAGTQYLRDLLWKYRNDPHQVSRALAAYNAGPGAVDRYHGIPPYRETLAYVESVLRKYAKQPTASLRAKPSAD
jgi:soluble lytic murein transglycosylase-like protein